MAGAKSLEGDIMTPTTIIHAIQEYHPSQRISIVRTTRLLSQLGRSSAFAIKRVFAKAPATTPKADCKVFPLEMTDDLVSAMRAREAYFND